MKIEKVLLLVAALLAAYGLGLFSAQYLINENHADVATVILKQIPSEEKLEAAIDIVAVTQQGQAGVINTATVEIIPGKGRVLFSLNPFVEPDTQQSAETAAKVAARIAGKSLADRDVIYSIGDTNAILVGGPSAGAALAAATIAALEGKKIRSDVEITGTIEADGTIGQIGGVLEKAAACAESGKKLFLLPKGQSKISYYKQQVIEEKRGLFTIQRIRYIPAILDVSAYATEQGWNLEIKEVANIEEAIGLLFE